MKKYRNFIILFIASCLIGGIFGRFSDELSEIDFTFGGDIDNYIFKIFLIISCIITIYLITTLIYLNKNYKKVNLNEIPKNIERKLTNAMHYCTVQLILGLVWDAVVFHKESLYLIMIPTASVVISLLLLILTIKYSNYLYPNRKLYIFENKSGKNLFQKLDDGEKWIIFNCSYTTFNKMQLVYAAVIVICIILSMFTGVPIILPIVVGLIWIIQISIYIHETRKYEDK